LIRQRRIRHPDLAFECREGQVYYFHGQMPVFPHAADNVASFRLFISQLNVNGSATQAQVSRAFGVPQVTVKRSCNKRREEWAKGFFAPRPPATGHKLTLELIIEAQALLNEGRGITNIGVTPGVLPNTLNKAISCSRLQNKPAETGKTCPALTPCGADAAVPPTSQSQRSVTDGAALFGIATTWERDRFASQSVRSMTPSCAINPTVNGAKSRAQSHPRGAHAAAKTRPSRRRQRAHRTQGQRHRPRWIGAPCASRRRATHRG